MKLWKKMIIAMALGVLVGIPMGEKAMLFKPIGTVFLHLLSMVVVLLVFASMVVGVTSINDPKKLGRVGLKTLGMYAATTAIAIGIGLLFAKLFNPGIGVGLIHPEGKIAIDETPELVNMFISLVPQNPIRALVNDNILQVIVFAIFLGLGINFAKEAGKPLLKVFESLAEVMQRMTGMVMAFAPIGVFAIMASVSGEFGGGILLPLLKFLMAHYLACILHMVVVFGTILVVMAKLKVRPFIRGMSDAITFALSTTSSSATLPVTMHCVNENLGVSKNISSFVLPLGATINMNGTAIFQGITAVFISQMYGIHLGWESLLLIVVTATLSAVGCAGIPGGGLVTMTIVLGAVGLPIEGIAIVAGIDRLRDTIGTVANVLGDATVALYVAKTEGELDEKKYASAEIVSYEKRTT